MMCTCRHISSNATRIPTKIGKHPEPISEHHRNDLRGRFPYGAATILSEIPTDAFAFFLIDPKGWRLPLMALAPLLRRVNSEVIFNFMSDFINRAASIRDPAVVAGLDELIPFGDWRRRLEAAERDGASPDER